MQGDISLMIDSWGRYDVRRSVHISYYSTGSVKVTNR